MKVPAIGQKVTCPQDRGSPPYNGVVTAHFDAVPPTKLHPEFTWVAVKANGHTSIWPSYRLAFDPVPCNQVRKGDV